MHKQKVKHSKIRNTGLLFEFLLRQITADVLEKTKHNKAVQIVKEHFNEKTYLGQELALYNAIVTKKFKSDKKAEYFVNEVLENRKKINNSILRREKYNLIKKLKESYNLQDFLSSKVINYKLYASIYKLFEYVNTISPDEKTESFFNLVEHITTNKKSINLSETVGGTKLPKNEDLRILTYKTLLERFNQKYTKLNLPQKSLLRAYINNVSGTNSIKEFIEKVRPVIKRDLKKYSKNLKDEVVKIKLKEAINSIDKLCDTKKTQSLKDSVVVQTMRYMELLKELKKSGNKDKKTL
tara:strand:- start:443 stop:1330 length:888 start_codon:yes stop_codon:yes gene_type:complete